MLRRVVGFRPDDEGHWIADLACLHSQHVRHQPPFRNVPWVLDESGRAERVGTQLACPLCDRAELPDGLRVVRTAGPFDAESLPAGLRRDHRVADGVWGCLRVLDGAVGFRMATVPPLDVRLHAGDAQPIPPSVLHRVVPDEVPDVVMEIAVDFLTRPDDRI